MPSSINTPSLWDVFFATVKRDLRVYLSCKGELMNLLVFFALVMMLFPLGIAADEAFLSPLAPGLIWVVALLAILLSLDSVFRLDFTDGSLQQMVLSPQPFSLICAAKVVAHWLVTGFPLAVLAPLLGIMLFLPFEAMPALVLSLLLGTPVLSFIGAIGSGLTVGLSQGGVLTALLVVPLYIPVLIFGSATVTAGVNALPLGGYLALMGALFVFTSLLAPLAISAAVKISVSS